jgi:hypothetical protein
MIIIILLSIKKINKINKWIIIYYLKILNLIKIKILILVLYPIVQYHFNK